MKEIRITDDVYINPAPSDFKLRQINYVREADSSLPLGRVVVLGTTIFEERDMSEGIIELRLNWQHPPLILEAGEKTPFYTEVQLVKNTTEKLYELGMTCYHWLVLPGETEFKSGGLTASKAYLTNNNDLGTIERHDFEFTPRMNGVSIEKEFIFRVEMNKETAYLQYDYVYEWVNGPVPDSEEIRVFINGNLLISDVPTMVISGRTLLPLRAILEALGVDVVWDGETRTISATKGDTVMALQIDNHEAILNGEERIVTINQD